MAGIRSILKGVTLTGSEDIDQWANLLMQVIFKMHEAGLSYSEIEEVMRKVKRQVGLTTYVEEWMKEFNPKGLEYVQYRPETGV